MDDATRIRALQIFSAHNQECAIQFIDYVMEKFPFRISTIQTDRDHEFQAHFHWHVEDLGIQHVYIKPHSSTEKSNVPTERIRQSFINC